MPVVALTHAWYRPTPNQPIGYYPAVAFDHCRRTALLAATSGTGSSSPRARLPSSSALASARPSSASHAANSVVSSPHSAPRRSKSHGRPPRVRAILAAAASTWPDCATDPLQYFYHGTIGFYSFYEEVNGTYCTTDHTIYGVIDALGTFDINGWLLAQDTGSYGYRWSGWYATVGTVLIIYRSFVIRRSYVACKRYGRKCDQLGEELDRNIIMVFVHENMRLSAHGATNYHRVGLLYLLIEGIMSDIFLLVATEGMSSWLQYISLGYNLSGVVLLLFEMVENMGWLRESTRLAIKRLLFSYESSLIGELLSAIAQSHFLTSLSHSDLKNSGFVARAVSYYVWGLVGHASIVLPLIGFIMFVRVVRAVIYIRWKHGVWWSIFTAPCCVDTTLGMLNKMKMLGGYEWKGGKLYYSPHALKAFGLLKMEEEDGTEFVVLRKLHWWKIPANDLVVIGVVTGQLVEPCIERPCMGMVSFSDRSLGGPLIETGRQRPRLIHGRSRIMPRQALMNVFPAT